MKKDEYNAIFNLLRQRMIIIPPECAIVRLRDIDEILYYFVEPRKLEGETDEGYSTNI